MNYLGILFLLYLGVMCIWAGSKPRSAGALLVRDVIESNRDSKEK